MDVNDSLELRQAIETAISEPTQTRHPNWLLLWLDRVKTSTAILLLCAAGLLAYANSFNGKFVWDDSNQIIHNQKIHSWKGIKQAFTTHVWQFMEETNSIKKVTYSGFYRPLFTVLFTVEYQLFGLKPQGWHLTSLLLHLLCSVMVYFVLLELSRRRSVALIAALLFAVYSIHVESVAWISGVTDPLFSLFLLLSLFLFLRFHATKKLWRLLCSVLCFALAVFSKETALCQIPVIFALTWLGSSSDANPDNEPTTATLVYRFRQAVLWSLPYLAVAALYLFIRYLVLGAIIRDSEVTYRGSSLHILLTLPYIIVSYLTHLLYPVDLTAAYYTSFITDVRSLRFAVPLLILILLIAIISVYRKRFARQVWYSLLLLFVPLLPALNLRPLGEQNLIADRYLYLSTAGWTFLLALGIAKLASLEQTRNEFQKLSSSFRRLGVASLLATALFTSMVAITWGENRNWKDDPSLWSQAIRKRPNNWLVYYYAGLAFLNEHRFQEAKEILSHPVVQTVESAEVANSLALAYLGLGDVENAVVSYNHALILNPQLIEAHRDLGILEFNRKDFTTAEQSFQAALNLNPDSADLHYYLALTYRLQGRFENAATEFQRALNYLPDDPEITCELGLIYEKLDRKEDAVNTLKRAFSLSKDQALSERIAMNLNRMTTAVP